MIGIDKVMKVGNQHETLNVEDDCFVHPVIKTKRKDKFVKFAPAFQKNDSCIKVR